jgi:hypothetical protein
MSLGSIHGNTEEYSLPLRTVHPVDDEVRVEVEFTNPFEALFEMGLDAERILGF